MRVLRNVLIGIASTLLAIACAGYLFIRDGGLWADRVPGRLETAIAQRLVVASIPPSDQQLRNPDAEADAWRAGADHYAAHCAGCHGADGRGHSGFGARMYPPVPDLSAPAIQNFSDGVLFSIIQHGVRWTGMPAFKAEHNADETWKLVAFIRDMPRMPTGDASRPAQRGAADRVRDRIVVMDGTAFEPGELTVKVGETVSWINRDPFPHNVSSAAGDLHSGDLDPGQQWSFQPTAPKTYSYVCTLHPGMAGRLIVTK
jgi:plastocyanin